MLTGVERLVLALVMVGFAAYLVWAGSRVVRMVLLGVAEDRFDQPARRLKGFFVNVFLQRRTFSKPVVGLFHFFIVWGFIVFAVNTVNHFFGGLFPGFTVFMGTPLDTYYAALADFFALLVITGVLGLAFRRYLLRPAALTRPSPESFLVLLFIGGAMVAYLCSNACEIALGHGESAHGHFASGALAVPLGGLSESARQILFHVVWWADAVMHLVLVALLVIPTKHVHLVAGSFNQYFRRLSPAGALTKIDLEDEDAESFGVSKIQEYSWKQILDTLSCIECGRCQEQCPAHNTDKPLNPRKLIRDLEHYLTGNAAKLFAQAKQNGDGDEESTEDGAEVPALIGETISEDVIWSCTTCGACVEHCPMLIEHIDKLVDMRRYLVLMESQFPQEAVNIFKNTENNGNPWGMSESDRTNWADGLEVPVFAEKKEADVLYWVGCAGGYDDRNKLVAQSLVKILQAAKVDFAILGDEESCCGDSARRLGNEYLFQMLAESNVETIKQYKFKKILVACPHGYNTLKNEYPQFGGAFEVVHHSEFILELIRDGKLKLNTNGHTPIAYHDSCYLGRQNDIYDPPRGILEATGRELAPVTRERNTGFCCGAGGGRMWLEETLGKRVNHERVEELAATEAPEIGTACPFCLTMIEGGLKETDREGAAQVRDLAEVVAAQIDTPS